MIRRVLFAFMIARAAPCVAQDVSLAGWKPERAAGGVSTWTHASQAAVVSLHELPGNANLSRMVEVYRRSLVTRCPELSRAAAQPIFDGRAVVLHSADTQQRCTIAYGGSAASQAIVISVEEVALGVNAAVRAQALLATTLRFQDSVNGVDGRQEGVRPSADRRPSGSPRVSSTSVAVAGATDDAMRATLASVPRANRPRFLFDRFSMRLVGTNLIRVNDVWMAFDNGYATNCFDWNPATTAPTPSTLGRLPECAIARWESRGDGTYRVLDKDGAAEDPLTARAWRPFRRGERVTVDFDSWDARGGPIAGAMPYASVTINELVLHADGSFGSAQQNERWITGSHRSNRMAASGRYHVDGYIMAVQNPNGEVSLHFTAYQLIDGRLRLIVLNGRQYSPK